MGVKWLNRGTPGTKHMTGLTFEELTRDKPEKSLTRKGKKTGGRGGLGKISVRHRGGGHKRQYREIDFKRDKFEVPAKVAAIEYDPNRSARLALLHYGDGEKRYILWPKGLERGAVVVSARKRLALKLGNAMPLKVIRAGTQVHNVELVPGAGGKLGRGAGSFATIKGREGDYVVLELPSKEIRMVHEDCLATVGQVGNVDWKNISLGKAGRRRWLGKRPKVRGTAQYPGHRGHPHGGGEARSGVGLKNPKSPWGKKTLGKKTRRAKKPSEKFIIRRRK